MPTKTAEQETPAAGAETLSAVLPQGEETPPAETGIEGEEPPAQDEWAALSPEEIDERLGKHEAWKTAHDTRLEETRTEAFRKGRSEGQSRAQPVFEEYRTQAASANAHLANTYGALKQALDDGVLDEKTFSVFAGELGQATTYLSKLAVSRGRNEGVQNMMEIVGKSLDNAELGKTFKERVAALGVGHDSAESIVDDLVDAIVKDKVDRAVKPLQNKVAKLEAALAEAKGQAREGKGPDTSARGSVGPLGNKRYGDLTPEERARLTPAQRDALIARSLR